MKNTKIGVVGLEVSGIFVISETSFTINDRSISGNVSISEN